MVTHLLYMYCSGWSRISFYIFGASFFAVQEFFWICICLPPLQKYKHYKKKTRRQDCNWFLRVFWFWRAENAIERLYTNSINWCLDICITIWNKHKPRIFPVWFVQIWLLEISAFLFKCIFQRQVWCSWSCFSFYIFGSCVFSVKGFFFTFLTPFHKFKHA